MISMYNIVTILLSLVFLASLLILAIRTKSIGIGLIFVALLLRGAFNLAMQPFMTFFIEKIKIGDISPATIFRFLIYSVSWSVLIVCTIGAFLVYNEWKNGKFQPPQPENRYQLHN